MKEHNWKRVREISRTHVVDQCVGCDILCIVDLDMPDTRLNYYIWPKSISEVETDCDEVIVKDIMES